MLRHRAELQKTLNIKSLQRILKERYFDPFWRSLGLSPALPFYYPTLINGKLLFESFVIKKMDQNNLLLYRTGNELILLNFKAISNFMGVK